MDSQISFIEEFAAKMGEWLATVIPDIAERTFAVSEVSPFTPENIPELPVGFAALVSQDYQQFPTIITTFVAEVVLEAVRAVTEHSESPFWAYYDTDAVRDTILYNLPSVEEKWGSINPVSLEVDSDRLAVYISMTFTRRSKWVSPEVCRPKAFCEPKVLEARISSIKTQVGPLIQRPSKEIDE